MFRRRPPRSAARHTGGPGPGRPPPESSFDWKQQSGKTIYPILVEHPYTDAMEPFFPEFEELTGITIKYEKLPETQFREKLLLALSTGAGTYDVFMTGYIDDFRYVGGGWIEPLDDYIADPALHRPELGLRRFLRVPDRG